MIKAFTLTDKDDNDVIEFLNKISINNPSVLGYHYPFYRNTLQSINIGEPYYIGVCDESNILTAIFPGFMKHTEMGTVYSSLPFFGPNSGLLFNKMDVNPREIYQLVFEELFHEFEKHNMISASFYTNFFDNSDYKYYDSFLNDSLVIDKFTNVTPLQTYESSSTIAYDIRKATKLGVQVRLIENVNDIKAIYDIYKQNCLDYNIPIKPYNCIENLIKKQNEQNVETYIATFNEEIISALVMVFSPMTSSYYLPCTLPEYRTYQPMSFLIDYAITESLKKGRKYWNWESSPSKESGVYKFKKKWGAIDGEYRIYIKSFKDIEFYKTLGQEKIAAFFPYYFVYPFNKLK
jgi:hypothetical protein